MTRIINFMLLPAFLLASGQLRAASDDWQLRMLNQPSEAQLALEKKGRVFIYDGLTDAQVDQAVEQQFDRMDAMMFIRTIVTDANAGSMTDPESGELIVEDDGCD